MRFTNAHDVVRSIPDGSSVVLPQGCSDPSSFYRAFVAELDRFRDLRLYSGLQFGDYPFLQRGLGRNYSYTTWHVGTPVRRHIDEGQASYLPLRYSDIPRQFEHPDVVVIQVSPPSNRGEVSLGVSVGVMRQLALNAKLLIAEVSDSMPFTCGESTLPIDQIDHFIEGDTGPVPYSSRPANKVSSTIAALASDLVPDGAWLQAGIGAIPGELLTQVENRAVNIHTGMITDQAIRLIDKTGARVVTAEVVGSEKLFRYVDQNPAVEVVPSNRSHDPRILGTLDRFVAINSALEVDLSGQLNSETINGVNVAGIGGSMDFMLGAALSSGGMSIVVLPSTAVGGKHSRIVRSLAPGVPVTVPRHCVDYVVTEYGVAELAGRDLAERARALIAVAHPDYRDNLTETNGTEPE